MLGTEYLSQLGTCIRFCASQLCCVSVFSEHVKANLHTWGSCMNLNESVSVQLIVHVNSYDAILAKLCDPNQRNEIYCQYHQQKQ